MAAASMYKVTIRARDDVLSSSPAGAETVPPTLRWSEKNVVQAQD